MANRVSQGKGSRDRTQDREAFDANYNSIRWSSRGQPVSADGEQNHGPAGRTQAVPQPDSRLRNKHTADDRGGDSASPSR